MPKTRGEMSLPYKFAEFVEERFNLSLDPSSFHRTYSGYWQLSKGAWKWWMLHADSARQVGSGSSLTDILKNKDYISFDGEEFFLESTKQNQGDPWKHPSRRTW